MSLNEWKGSVFNVEGVKCTRKFRQAYLEYMSSSLPISLLLSAVKSRINYDYGDKQYMVYDLRN